MSPRHLEDSVPMIIDSHAYCFGPADSPRGYADLREHLREVQMSHARHHQPAFRIRDRVEGPSDVLDPRADGDLDALPDLNFRVDRSAGRVLWDYQGETYTKHYYPPNLRNLEFTPDSLIGEMDHAGIDWTLLHTNAMLGRSNEYQAECVSRYPDRLLSMAAVDEKLIHTDVDSVVESVTMASPRPRSARDQVQRQWVHRQRRAVGQRTVRTVLGGRFHAGRTRIHHACDRPGPREGGRPRSGGAARATLESSASSCASWSATRRWCSASRTASPGVCTWTATALPCPTISGSRSRTRT